MYNVKHVVSTSKCGQSLFFAMILPISAVESFPKCLGKVGRVIQNYLSKKLRNCVKARGTLIPSAFAIQTVCAQNYFQYRYLVSKETVVLRRWGRSKQKFGFIERVDKC